MHCITFVLAEYCKFENFLEVSIVMKLLAKFRENKPSRNSKNTIHIRENKISAENSEFSAVI